MKGQLSLEFVVILLLLTAYLSVVFTLFSSARAELERAMDNKVLERVTRWTEFIFRRPDRTTLRLEINPPPRRFVSIDCGKETKIATATKTKKLDIESYCSSLNFSSKARIEIQKQKGGIKFEVV